MTHQSCGLRAQGRQWQWAEPCGLLVLRRAKAVLTFPLLGTCHGPGDSLGPEGPGISLAWILPVRSSQSTGRDRQVCWWLRSPGSGWLQRHALTGLGGPWEAETVCSACWILPVPHTLANPHREPSRPGLTASLYALLGACHTLPQGPCPSNTGRPGVAACPRPHGQTPCVSLLPVAGPWLAAHRGLLTRLHFSHPWP